MSQNEDASYSRPRKPKATANKAASPHQIGIGILPSSKPRQKVSKRILKNESPVGFQQPERSNSDSLPDSSTSGNEYRALRRKYLLLEEESFALGTQLREAEAEVETLEGEKLALLDELVVLEGLIDRADLQTQGSSHLPRV